MSVSGRKKVTPWYGVTVFTKAIMKPTISFVIIFLLMLFSLLPVGCAQKPLTVISAPDYPLFTDDLDYQDLDAALEKSLTYLRRLPPSTVYTIDNRRCTVADITRSIVFFRKLVAEKPSPQRLNELIVRHFSVYQARGIGGYNPDRSMLVTGYYQPLFAGSLKRTEAFSSPLYKVPGDLVIRHIDRGKKKQTVGRMEQGQFMPYWTRGEIERNNLLNGQELIWLKNPLDAFVLHIQGSGLISLPDGSIRGVHYARRNGRSYSSIGKYMVENCMLTLEEASLDSIRAYIDNNPEQRDLILHHNESFIFFDWGNAQGAVGSLGQVLTPGRSIAADKTCFPPGSLVFLRSRKPVVREQHIVKWNDLQRFVTIQDSGSAIRGPGRVDLFWGSGADAGLAAGRMKEDGAFYLLLLKQEED